MIFLDVAGCRQSAAVMMVIIGTLNTRAAGAADVAIKAAGRCSPPRPWPRQVLTPRIAFAPRRALLSVPSSSIWPRSIPPAGRVVASWIASATRRFDRSHGIEHALSPCKRPCSPSRRSTASYARLEAPEGTAARPIGPSFERHIDSTVGLPRLSRISRAWMSMMVLHGSVLPMGVFALTFGCPARSSRGRGGREARARALASPSPRRHRAPTSIVQCSPGIRSTHRGRSRRRVWQQ